MKQKSSSKRKQEPKQNSIEDIADKTTRNYDRTVKTGMKFQEDAMQWWTKMVNQAASATDWQRRFTELFAMTGDMMPSTQRRMQEMMDLMNRNSRTGAEIMSKAVEAAQTPAIGESQSKWLEVWVSSLGAIRTNIEAITRINNHLIDSWIDFARKNTEVTEVRVPKMA